MSLVWLGRLTRSQDLDFSKKKPYILSKMAPMLADFEVEHDFLKTVLPMVILKLVCQRSNFTRF